jgi:nitroimidazol reductase NimA-like FMN-containing flavoprotein (pyridoxamine 5'-phosphate oxidase superfamily)
MKKQLSPEKTTGTAAVAERLNVMNRTQRHAVLATISDGQPYTSLVAFAMTPDMKQAVFATPRNTAKYRNILNNRKVALLIDTRSNTDAAYMKSETVTVIGTAVPVRRGRKRESLSRILTEKHPVLRRFVQSKTTAIIVVEAEKCFHTGSFQQVSEWRVRKS